MKASGIWQRVEAALCKEIVSHASIVGFFNVLFAYSIVDTSVMHMSDGAMTSPQAYAIVRDLGCAFAAVASAVGFWTRQKWARHVGTSAWIVQFFAYGWFFVLLAWTNWFLTKESVKQRRVFGERP